MEEGEKRLDDECVCVFVHIPNRLRVFFLGKGEESRDQIGRGVVICV